MLAPKRAKWGEGGGSRRSNGVDFWNHFRSGNPGKSRKRPSEKTWKNGHPKTWKCMLKRCQNGIEMYAKTHQKSMQKLVMGNIRKMMKNHVFPMCKTMQNHHTVSKKRGLARWMCGAGKSWNNMKNEVKIRHTINEKIIRKRCSNKWWRHDEKRCQNGAQKGATVQKNLKNGCQKRCRNFTPKPVTLHGCAGEVGGSL